MTSVAGHRKPKSRPASPTKHLDVFPPPAYAQPVVIRAKVNSIAQTNAIGRARNVSNSSAPPVARPPSPFKTRPTRTNSSSNLSAVASSSSVSSPVTSSHPNSPSPTIKARRTVRPVTPRAGMASVSNPSARSAGNLPPAISVPLVNRIPASPPKRRTSSVSETSNSSLLSGVMSAPATPLPRIEVRGRKQSPSRASPTFQIKSKVSQVLKSRPLSTIMSSSESYTSPPVPITSSEPPHPAKPKPVPSRIPRSPARSPNRSPSPTRTRTLRPTSRSRPHFQSSTSPPTISPRSIPLPPQSPSTSAISFSSVSSSSASQVRSPLSDLSGHSTDPPSRHPSSPPKSTVFSRGGITPTITPIQLPVAEDFGTRVTTSDEEVEQILTESDSDSGEDSEVIEEHRSKAAAKTDRKIADLEITNKSLLAINGNLESVKHRQAKEIRELRRKLRESRLVLPPVRFKMLESTEGDQGEKDPLSEEEESEEESAKDENFERVKRLVEDLLSTARRALESKPEDHTPASIPKVQVLHADEVADLDRERRVVPEDGDTTIDAESIGEVSTRNGTPSPESPPALAP
ncbi:hypothetical protein SISNIDRAFT_485603 [Sistotremastrum niveocremeum HHB9708]|uniref:Uncharacterized protein n=1 Tax=Sistotremastrum niveocremeum HHB9708 TaxID=1314777 RepID=A0A164ULJ3_9AGAM|nr:hypothetical protein SISNIDRAFT_485603 [Sistotremastrum niveocremeum HHB9708]